MVGPKPELFVRQICPLSIVFFVGNRDSESLYWFILLHVSVQFSLYCSTSVLMMITMVKILRANAKALTTKKPESAIAKGLFNSEKEAV